MESLADKYRPRVLDDMILNPEIRKVIQDFLDKKTIQSLLLSGKQGIGKSTLADIIVNTLGSTFLYINCGLDGGVNTMREKVREFCDSVAINPEVPKIVILDEADALLAIGETADGKGGKSSAQGALRNLIDQSSDDTRFILTCNYLSRIMEPLKSRCIPIQMNFSVDDITKKCLHILKTEKIKTDKDIFKQFIKNVIKICYPDIRLVINNLEQWIVTGSLTPIKLVEDKNMDEFIFNLFQIIIRKGLPTARKWYLNNEDKFDNDYQKLTIAIFKSLMNDPKKQEVLGESLRHFPHVLDKEVEFYLTMLKIKKLI